MSGRDSLMSSRGVTPIIANVLLISIMSIAIGVLTYQIVSSGGPRGRYVNLAIRLENTGSSDEIKVVLMHMGGDEIGIDDANELEDVRVSARPPLWEENQWENYVPQWEFSDLAYGFEAGENAVGYIRHDAAQGNLIVGYELQVSVVSLRTDKFFLDRTLEIKNSAYY